MAFFARNPRVQAGEWKFGLAVIEIVYRFPVYEVVALRAVRAESALMWILVAAGALPRKTQKRVAQVFHLDQRFGGLLDMRGRVALIAFEAGVLAFERISSLAVVECFQRRLPSDQGVIPAVVFGMARGAVLFIWKPCVQSTPGCDLSGNFFVALLAFQFGRASPDDVATGALRGAAERFMSPRKRPGRNLRANAKRCSAKQNHYK